MIHNIRRKDGTVYPLDVEIGSGVLDKNGKEIFEGDIVKVDGERKTYKVMFSYGSGLVLMDYKNMGLELQCFLDRTYRGKGFTFRIEVIEHDDD